MTDGARPPGLRVEAGGIDLGYEVHVGQGVRHRLPDLLDGHVGADRYVVISDDRVWTLHGEPLLESLRASGLDADSLSFPEGEASKSRGEWSRLTDAMLGMGLTRASAVVAVGGGVAGDLAGFTAATFLRGIPVVQVPTTVLSMIDASVGGKTGINASVGKNLIGAFHPPALVVVDPEFLQTLPRDRRAEGYAEALKHGAIRDAAHLDELEELAKELLDGEPRATSRVIQRSIEIKAEVVGLDERESGLREVLNFGHTIGHAIEAGSGYALHHGVAVALGMVAEARLGEHLGVTRPGTADRLRRAVEAFELPTASSPVVSVPDALAALERDKKSRGGSPQYVLLEAVGAVAKPERGWSRPVPSDLVRSLLEGLPDDTGAA